MEFPDLPGRLARVRETVAPASGGRRAGRIRCGSSPSPRAMGPTRCGPPRRLVSRMWGRIGSRRRWRSRTRLADVAVVWHLIGTLQRNKARHAAGRFALIHSVDRADLAAEMDRRVDRRQPPAGAGPGELLGRAAEGRRRARRLPALLDALRGIVPARGDRADDHERADRRRRRAAAGVPPAARAARRGGAAKGTGCRSCPWGCPGTIRSPRRKVRR